MFDSKEITARAIATYKGLLRRALDNRPSGTRLKLAAALGTNRSFVSQITNPGYPIPIPVQHLEVIFDVCRLAPAERAEFLEAYHAAHPGRVAGRERQPRTRSLAVTLPDLGDERRNQAMEKAVLDFVARLVHYTRELDQSPKSEDAAS
ncbi:hypothetical protein [Labrys monachus]|uniref:XRE family transcriptional regulator n=1 Tax=Labrys monachus TaxID=217067 RepID=A0ABU0FJD2_9HYPH|nr:hypothetical protein [Labrys monachus]MDQ0394714.1 hypothetical protein [Labrys monachus]